MCYFYLPRGDMYSKTAITAILATAATTSWAQPSQTEGQAEPKETSLTISANYDYTSGSYGTSTKLPAATWSAGIVWDIDANWALDIDLPYLRQTTPVVTGSTTVRIVRIGGKLIAIRGLAQSTSVQKVTGQGDATALLTRSFDSGAGAVWSAGAKVKFATASASSGLGTGKNDLSLQTGVVNDFGALTAGATAGYTLVGRVDGLGLRNTAYLDLDGSYKVNQQWSLGANLSASQAPVAGTPGPLSASASVSYKFGSGSYLTANVLRGLSDASPKWGVGLGVNVGF